jgi:hypothetical protein
MNTESNEQEKNCLLVKHFNTITDYIKVQGKQIKLSKRLLSDKESLLLEISVSNRYLELEEYQGYKRIIVIDKSEDNKISAYFVSNKNNEILISAYYSRFDIEEDIKTRTEDWCNVISEFTGKQ